MFENLDQSKGQNLTGQTTPPAPVAGSNPAAKPAGSAVPIPKAPVEDMFAGVKDVTAPVSKTLGQAPVAPGRSSGVKKSSSGGALRTILVIVIILIIIGLGIFIAGKFLGVEMTNPASWASKFSSLSGLFVKQPAGETVLINNQTPTPATNQDNVTPPATPAVTPATPVVSTTPPATVPPPVASTTVPTSPSTPIVASSTSTLDSDHDGLTDYEEINVYHTNPDKADSDNDGLTDYQEVKVYHTDPNNPDTDGDGYTDGSEVQNGYNPLGSGKLK